MISWLANRKLMGTDAAADRQHIVDTGRSVIGRILEVLHICRRAGEAAHYYEQLKPQSDEALAEKGLKRSDLTRAAFDRLNEQD